jgi:hypothetical protein
LQFRGIKVTQAVSPVTGASALAAVKQLVLDSVSSPLTRVMYARALKASVITQNRPYMIT